ncbi:MAG: efflux RND transporter periplasmic adaptor subunit [Bacteroidetes bacterium]|nr:efflux RND transporter periplasmic adaptor subunit [Bacteroidota bacterium]
MAKRKNKIIIIIIAVILILALIIGFLFLNKPNASHLEVNTIPITDGSIEITITASGEIQPVYKVEVGTQVSGIVEKLYVDYNSVVKKGQLLAELDKSTLLEQVRQSEASLSDAQSSLTLSQQNYDRIKQLYDNKAATLESLENATNELVQAKNRVVTAKSTLQKAQVNLSYSKIYSPIDGTVLSKSVEEGQTVASSFSTPTIFTIANDLKHMQVEANVDEADIGQVKAGQPVTFTVDAYPDDVFQGTVRQVRLEPTVTANVVTYRVIIDAPNEDEKLFPGMTANVSIVVDNQKGLIIPLSALYLNITDEMQKKLEKQNIKIDSKIPPTNITESLKNIKTKIVWTKEGNKLKQKTITVGINDGANSIIESGLSTSDVVVTSITESAFPMERVQVCSADLLNEKNVNITSNSYNNLLYK